MSFTAHSSPSSETSLVQSFIPVTTYLLLHQFHTRPASQGPTHRSRFGSSPDLRDLLFGSRRCGAAGGVLRNNNGEVVMAFAQPLGNSTSASHAELQALTLGLKACINAGYTELLVEADCMEMVNKICSKEIDPGPGNLIYEDF